MFTYSHIARCLKVAPQTISRICSGRRRPSPELAKRLAVYFPGTTPWEWIESPTETWATVNQGRGLR